MNNFLLFSDPHFTANPIEEYRWSVFAKLLMAAETFQISDIVCLGDVVDSKDRHSSVLVNKLIEEFSYLQSHSRANIIILSGNHEKPLNGPYYWQFLDKLGIRYITKPEIYKDIWLLPFSSQPIEDWKELNLASAKAIFMHQTGQGATVENERELISNNLPIFPRGVAVFSGDVHRPQTVGGITYIGAPHPVRFGETWDNRAITVINNDFKNFKSLALNSIKKDVLDIRSASDLDYLKDYAEGDQVKIRYHMTGKQLTSWPDEQARVKAWAVSRKVYIASIENILVGDGVKVNSNTEAMAMEMMTPAEIITSFGKDEKLSKDVIEMGIQLVKAVQ